MDLKRVRDEVYALALPRWEQRKAGLPRGKVGWSYADVSLAMPTAWPPDGRGLLCHYVGAHGYAQGLVDGVMVARPWAKVLADPRGESPATFEIVTDEIVVWTPEMQSERLQPRFSDRAARISTGARAGAPGSRRRLPSAPAGCRTCP